jgi:hypothetical protein
MSTLTPKTAAIDAITLSPSTIFGRFLGRFLALIDRVLMANARIAIRNGDVPRIGL